MGGQLQEDFLLKTVKVQLGGADWSDSLTSMQCVN